MRITAWLRVSYLLNHTIGPILDALAPFLTPCANIG
jgi:hypothetical protein